MIFYLYGIHAIQIATLPGKGTICLLGAVNISSSNFDIEISSYFDKLILEIVLIVKRDFLCSCFWFLAFLGPVVCRYFLKCKTYSLTETDFILN